MGKKVVKTLKNGQKTPILAKKHKKTPHQLTGAGLFLIRTKPSL